MRCVNRKECRSLHCDICDGENQFETEEAPDDYGSEDPFDGISCYDVD